MKVLPMKKTLVSLLLPAAVLGLLLLPELAAAAEGGGFNADDILPSAVKDKDFLTQVFLVITMALLAAVFVMIGFGVLGGIGDVFASLSDARRMGEWAAFMKTLAMVMGAVILAVVLAATLIGWVANVSISTSVTFASG